MILDVWYLAERRNMSARDRLLRWGAMTVTLLLAFLQPALAADDGEKLPPYDVQGLSHTKIWLPWVFAFLFAAVGIAVAFKNPHRASIERD